MTEVGVRARGGLKSKIVLKVCWKLLSKYLATEDKMELIGGGKSGAKVGTRDIAEACHTVRAGMQWSPFSVGVALASLSSLLRKRF